MGRTAAQLELFAAVGNPEDVVEALRMRWVGVIRTLVPVFNVGTFALRAGSLFSCGACGGPVNGAICRLRVSPHSKDERQSERRGGEGDQREAEDFLLHFASILMHSSRV